MNKIYDYTNLTFNELIEKISTARFFHLPKMVAEVLKRLTPQAPKYKVYTALLTQSGTDAPVATVLENTLGDIVWSRFDTGIYQGTLIGAFKDNKTYTNSKYQSFDDGAIVYTINKLLGDENAVIVTTLTYVAVVPAESTDGGLINTPIEIRVYN